MGKIPNKKAVYSWAMYDWANSVFATAVMSAFFPIFFKKYWAGELDMAVSTKYLGSTNSIAGLAVALSAPFLGAIADNAKTKKYFLFLFAALGIVSTIMLYYVERNDWFSAATLYTLAMIGFIGSIVFYDSMLVRISNPDNIDRISVLGFALGYLGGGVLFAVNVLMYLKPDLFGISSAPEAIKLSFVSVGIWWAVFSIPMFIYVDDRNPEGVSVKKSIRKGLRQLADTISRVRKQKNILLFLISYWVYIDGIHTIVVMATDYGLRMGLEQKHLIGALLLVQFVGFPAALSFTWVAERFNAKTGIIIALISYMFISIYAYWLDTEIEFYILAASVGLVQGGAQSLSRSLFASIIPAERAAQYFGLYNMMGKFAAIIGPFLVGSIGIWTGNVRFSLPIIAAMFIIGIALLLAVDPNKKYQEDPASS